MQLNQSSANYTQSDGELFYDTVRTPASLSMNNRITTGYYMNSNVNKTQPVRLRPVIQKLEDLGLTGEIISIRTDGKTGTLVPDLMPGTCKTGPCQTNWIMTGNWIIADSRDYFEHVVLCVMRQDGAWDIFTGSFTKLCPVENSKRKVVKMSKPVLVGMTYSIPKVFNGGKYSGQGVTYISIPTVTFPTRTYQEGQEQITMSSPDQRPFPEEVMRNCAGMCALTDVRARQRTDAAHIKPRYAGGEPDVTNGILLRKDLHTLFDSWHFSIDPDSLKAHFSLDVLSVDEDLQKLEDTKVKFFRLQKPVNIEYLRYHWNEFLNLHGDSFRKKAKNL